MPRDAKIKMWLAIAVSISVLVGSIFAIPGAVYKAAMESRVKVTIQGEVGDKLDQMLELMEFRTYLQIRTIDGETYDKLESEWLRQKGSR